MSPGPKHAWRLTAATTSIAALGLRCPMVSILPTPRPKGKGLSEGGAPAPASATPVAPAAPPAPACGSGSGLRFGLPAATCRSGFGHASGPGRQPWRTLPPNKTPLARLLLACQGRTMLAPVLGTPLCSGLPSSLVCSLVGLFSTWSPRTRRQSLRRSLRRRPTTRCRRSKMWLRKARLRPGT